MPPPRAAGGTVLAALLAAAVSAAVGHGQEAAAPPAGTPAGGAIPPIQISPLQMMRHPTGDRLPDTPLVDDTGRNLRFLTDLVKDRAVVITFFYTNCRGTCPGTNLVLAELRELLAQDFGRSLRLISISFEPEKDDVKAIAEYAAQFRVEATDVDTPEWLFLTGGPDDIRELRRALQLYDLDEAVDRDPSQHAAAVIVGNHATGRWGILPVGIGPKRLAERIRAVAGWTAGQRYPQAVRSPAGDANQAQPAAEAGSGDGAAVTADAAAGSANGAAGQ